jgi:hypothetical protein
LCTSDGAEQRKEEHPDLWVAIGEPLAAERDVAAGVRAQHEGIERELLRIGAAIGVRAPSVPEGFAPVVVRGPSVASALASRLLVRLLPV